jgi:hypothetical protein
MKHQYSFHYDYTKIIIKSMFDQFNHTRFMIYVILVVQLSHRIPLIGLSVLKSSGISFPILHMGHTINIIFLES